MENNEDYMLGMHEGYMAREYDYSISYTMEIPTQLVRNVLPKSVQPASLRPQVSLMTISITSFGELEGGIPLTEVSLAINAMPNIFLAGEMPRFALYILNTGSTVSAPEFTAASEAFQLPLHPEALTIDLNRETGTVKCSDAAGNPIFELNDLSLGLEEKVFTPKENLFQVFTGKDGALYHSKVKVFAPAYEHQKAGQAGKLYKHDFFNGLEVAELETYSYLQMVTPQETTAKQVYFLPAKK
jgi:hypothetical protein